MIEVIGITKKYGQDYPLTDVSLKAEGCVAVLGRKRAGKTALADIITGCVYPESGSVIVFGHDVAHNPVNAKSVMGYMPQQPPEYPGMTTEDYLDFVCSLRGLKGSKATNSRNEALERAKAKSLSGHITGLSRFDQKKLSLAGALCGSPRALIIDEPTDGLEPAQAFEMREIIEDLRKDHMLLLFTRSIHEATQICESVAVLKGERITARESSKDLTSSAQRQRRITVKLKADRQQGHALLKSIEGVEFVHTLGSSESGASDFIVEATCDVRESVFCAASKAGIVLVGMGCLSVTLDDIYAELTGGGAE